MTSEQGAICVYIYICVCVSRSFVNEVLFDFTMARIQLVLVALLASSISVRARSTNYRSGGAGNNTN